MKGMVMFFEVKGCQAMRVESTIFEVMGKRLLEEMGYMFNEVVCLELLDIEATSFEAKGRMILEVMYFEATNIETTIHEAKCEHMKGIEVVTAEAMGKARTQEESSFEGKGNEYTIVEEMGMIFEEKGIEDTIVEEMGMMMIIVTKGMELINEALGKEMINEAKGQDEFWLCWGRPPRSSVCC